MLYVDNLSFPHRQVNEEPRDGRRMFWLQFWVHIFPINLKECTTFCT